MTRARETTETLLVRTLARHGWKRLEPWQIDAVALELRHEVERSLGSGDGPGETVDRLMAVLERGVLGPIDRRAALDILVLIADLALQM